MTGEWLQVSLSVPPVSREAASYILFDLGAGAVWEDNPDSAGNLVLKASFAREEAMRLMTTLPPALTRAAKSFDLPVKSFNLSMELLPLEDYAELWKAEQRPVMVSGRLILSPTFWEGDLREYFGLPEGSLPPVLKIDPGAAFGSGRHPTTFLSLKILSELAESGLTPERILDLGAGSGILALAAAVLFPGAVVEGVDTDPETVPVALANRDLNLLTGSISFSGEPLNSLKPGFSIILANLSLNPLLKLAPDIKAAAAPGSHLILSGIIAEQADELAEAFLKDGWSWLRHLGQAEWSALSFKLPDVPSGSPPSPPPARVVAPEPSLETRPEK
ncbi:MAG: 50S ribosomal protein L11 methyltransferase [Deltaproteobacteria bacterium]|jgi:ribosomal protein L11 methyltransferase|nr:50S ribosomal protein L11 methyltransferase [Deltaproteobacteria bacterium]